MSNHTFIARLATAALILCGGLLTGCASQKLAAHQPSVDSVQSIRNSGMAPVNVGDFKVAPAANVKIDKLVTVRGSQLTSPNNDSFSAYLRESLLTDLKSAGKYDPASALTVSAQLLRNELNAAGFSKADASLGAKFSVARAGTVLFDKDIVAQETWDSSFIGAIAIPDAINHYTDIYSKLLQRLFADEEFKRATASQGGH
jgi:hypothetical protein